MIELRQDVTVSVGLLLTPNIDLSLKILAMNVLEIEEKLKELAEENPLVVIEDDEQISVEASPKTALEDAFKELDEAYRERFDAEDRPDPFETFTPGKESLQESLIRQAKMEFDLDEESERIVSAIVHSLDEKGFLDLSVDEIADAVGVEPDRVEGIRRKVMQLEPLGCASRNFVEFLKLQAAMSDCTYKEKLFELIDRINGSNRVNLRRIRQQLDVDEEVFKRLLDELSSYSLYPLEHYPINDERIYIEPDVYIKRIGSELVAVLNERSLSRLHVDEEMLEQYLNSEEAKDFIEEKYRQLKQFMLAITQRNRTLLKTVNLILKKQRQFFENGVLMPLTRKDIADELGYNVSTITRAVSNKFVEYEGKIFPLKRFFSFGVNENVSKDFIKNRIKSLIEAEDKNNPLNDDRIKALLEKEGIRITRRTVTKYRKELSIPNSRERRCRDI